MNLLKLATIAVRQAARIPLTLAMCVLAVTIACVPTAAEALQFDRSAIEAGELWRLATCHLTHWNADHLQWDLLMFAVLGAACELRGRRRMWLCTALAAGTVSMLVFCLFPDVDTYRGLSGIDTSLFAMLAIDLLADARRERSVMPAVAIGGLLFALVAKTAYEALTGQAMFVDQSSAGFELLVWDHIVAAVVGSAAAVPRLHFGVAPQGACPRVMIPNEG